MRIAYLDCFSGISGDMFVGALVDAGVDPELLHNTVRALNLGAELEISRVSRAGVSAAKVDVIVAGVKDAPRDITLHAHEYGLELHDAKTHPRETAPHEYGLALQEHEHAPGHRGLKEIQAIVEAVPISDAAKKTALLIFQLLAEAEAKVHNQDIESVHFHEVGAVDAMVDIVCAAVGVEALGVDEWQCSALNVGGGRVECAHGILPVPAPATLKLLEGAPIYSGETQKELVTPTGAAIVRALVKTFGGMPAMKVQKIGYGAGTRDFKSSPNVVRITVGDQIGATTTSEIVVLEANVDDMTPQVFGYVIDKLLEAGALDAFGTQAHMKKNRPGMLLTALVKPEDEERLSQVIFAETTTIGLRARRESRRTLERRFVTITTEWGEVKIKLAELNGKLMNAAPEFDDCRRSAVEHKVALKKVMSEAMRVFGLIR